MKLLISLMLMVCLAANSQPVIDQAFTDYFKSFATEAKKHKVNADFSKLKSVTFCSRQDEQSLQLKTRNPNYLAVTAINENNGEMYILINAYEWYSIKQQARELTIYHELFHALGVTDHDCNGLMSSSPSDIDYDYYAANRQKHLNDLFAQLKKLTK